MENNFIFSLPYIRQKPNFKYKMQYFNMTYIVYSLQSGYYILRNIVPKVSRAHSTPVG